MLDRKEIESIDTDYKGYKFRSRLEARWAVFFEELDLLWKYEPERIKLTNGDPYLPDFYLPEKEFWLEIKPVKKSVSNWPDHPALQNFPSKHTNNAANRQFYLIKGRPYIGQGHGTEEAKYEIFVEGDSNYYFCECPKCGEIGIEFMGRAERLGCSCNIEETHNLRTDKLLEAYEAASKIRFEDL